MEGCWYEVTHQCPRCGFCAHQTVWRHRLLRDLDDLYKEVAVDSREDCKVWAEDCTDGMVYFSDAELPNGITTVSSAGFGQVFQLPGDLRGIMADIQTAATGAASRGRPLAASSPWER